MRSGCEQLFERALALFGRQFIENVGGDGSGSAIQPRQPFDITLAG
jgi:hypothetical protein